ncbi:MAG: glucose-1-phosphate adenylyltransferase [Oscillospiraceae bacterium]|nr:glucose-1-phosphate adenylyltransferase [Oscillospiraceae bacterium]MDY3066149.1 glucose-1-phosphate adenylyltransferase [Oscillospiraceae bacterium]
MNVKKKCVAMLLAGGQGSRLYALTQNRAKPAVPYGGKYKIIDFPLSNCIHSGIDTVGVLTQYEPLELNAYIGNGATWDLDCMSGGAYVLPPYVKGKKGEWYSGTASAIFQNIHFIEQYNPEYILILSGDHIYTMDYEKMIDAHEENGADATIAVMEVPMAEASRFGIMNTDDDMRIVEFEEKPPVPKNNLASMGIYVFSWKKLREYLIADNQDPNSSNDFGKNIIPNMLNNGEKMFAYLFSGYWKDVGTIDSLWEANMDLLAEKPELDLHDDNWRIYGRNLVLPPHFIGEEASVRNSILCDGCNIYGTVENSILSPGVTVEKGAYVKDSIIMQQTVIRAGSSITRAIIDEDVTIMEDAKIGGDGKITVVGSELTIPKGAEIKEGEMLYPRVK